MLLLVRTLGYQTLNDMCEKMESDEFFLWLAEYQRRPWGEERADLRAGIVASTVANFSGRSLKDNHEKSAFDFMPYYESEPEEIEPDFEYLKNFMSEKNAWQSR